MTDHIDIVFDGPPGPEAPKFVEVENDRGESISIGEWVKRDDGYWVLRIESFDTALRRAREEGAREMRERVCSACRSFAEGMRRDPEEPYGATTIAAPALETMASLFSQLPLTPEPDREEP